VLPARSPSPQGPRGVVMPKSLSNPRRNLPTRPPVSSDQVAYSLPPLRPPAPHSMAASRPRTAEPYVMVSTPTPPPTLRARTPFDWLLRRRKPQVSDDPTPPQIFIEPPVCHLLYDPTRFSPSLPVTNCLNRVLGTYTSAPSDARAC
jgi:hypothetical protein